MNKIRRFVKSTVQNIRNLIYFFCPVWEYRTFDHAYMDKLVLKSLQKQYNYYLKGDDVYQVTDNNFYKYILQPLRISINLLERYDTFHTNNYWIHCVQGKKPWDDKYDKCEQRDRELAYKIIGKYGMYWWD